MSKDAGAAAAQEIPSEEAAITPRSPPTNNRPRWRVIARNEAVVPEFRTAQLVPSLEVIIVPLSPTAIYRAPGSVPLPAGAKAATANKAFVVGVLVAIQLRP